jgi:hypothetical protein
MKKVKSKKAILTHSSGPQGNLKQLFFCSNSKSKIVASVDGAYVSKDKMVRIWPTLKKKKLFQPSSPLPIETLCHNNH